MLEDNSMINKTISLWKSGIELILIPFNDLLSYAQEDLFTPFILSSTVVLTFSLWLIPRSWGRFKSWYMYPVAMIFSLPTWLILGISFWAIKMDSSTSLAMLIKGVFITPMLLTLGIVGLLIALLPLSLSAMIFFDGKQWIYKLCWSTRLGKLFTFLGATGCIASSFIFYSDVLQTVFISLIIAFFMYSLAFGTPSDRELIEDRAKKNRWFKRSHVAVGHLEYEKARNQLKSEGRLNEDH